LNSNKFTDDQNGVGDATTECASKAMDG